MSISRTECRNWLITIRIFSFFVCGMALVSCSRSSSPLPTTLSNGGAPAWDATQRSETSFTGQPDVRAAYKVLYSFKGGTDGASLFDGLLALNGKLYGTTLNGGTGCSGVGCGTVFEMSTSGVKKVLHRFKNTPDGYAPFASLLPLHGKLYGTTQQGGASAYGTVFEVSTFRREHVLYSFKGPTGRRIAVCGSDCRKRQALWHHV